MRFIVLCFFFIVSGCMATYAQEDSTVRPAPRIITPAQPGSMQVLDSVILATAARKKFVEDSLAFQYIKYPDSTISREVAQQYLHDHLYQGKGFLDIPFKSKSTLRNGHTRQTRDQWIIIIIIGLVLYAAILNIIFNKNIKNVFLSFYSKRALVQAGKDDAQINFWVLKFLGFVFDINKLVSEYISTLSILRILTLPLFFCP
jgi:hypothetical protein